MKVKSQTLADQLIEVLLEPARTNVRNIPRPTIAR